LLMETKFSDNKQVGVQAVRRALDLLIALARTGGEASLTELRQKTGLNKSTAYQLLAGLRARGFVEQNSETRHYRLGPTVLEIAASFLDESDLITRAQPMLNQIRDRTGETATLHLLVGDQRVTVAKAESLQTLRRAAALGEVGPLLRGAAGKSILAFMGPRRIQSVISRAQRSGALKKAERQSLLNGLESIRTRGFWINRGEHVPGGFGVAVPLFGPGSEVIGSLALSGPLQRLTASLRDLAVELLTEAGRRISGPRFLTEVITQTADTGTGRRRAL
jgi:DNA-binding IclR family transcriptional regulator